MTVPQETVRLLDSAVRNDLQDLRDKYFLRLLVSAVIVALGVGLEGPEIVKDILERFSKSRISKNLAKWITLVSALGWTFVAIGVAGEFVMEGLVSKADALIQTFESELLADSQKQTAFALADAESAKALAKGYESQIAESNARAKAAEAQVASATAASADAVSKVAAADARSAEASAKAEGFRLDIAKANASAAIAQAEAAKANLELARLKAPRTLTDEQATRIAHAVASFAGQEFDITPYRDIEESLNIANRILQTLVSNTAGWLYRPLPNGSFLIGGLEGVQVWRHPEADKKAKDAADSLVTALNREGIAAVLRMENPKNPKENKINLNIGTKP